MGSTYAAVHENPLLNLYDRTSPVPFRDPEQLQDYRALELPNTERAVNQTAVTLGHVHLLGSQAYISDLLEAVKKVDDNLDRVKKWWQDRAKEEG